MSGPVMVVVALLPPTPKLAPAPPLAWVSRWMLLGAFAMHAASATVAANEQVSKICRGMDEGYGLRFMGATHFLPGCPFLGVPTSLESRGAAAAGLSRPAVEYETSVAC